MVKIKIRNYATSASKKEFADKWFGGEVFEASISKNVVIMGEHIFNMRTEAIDIEGFALVKDHFYFLTNEATGIEYEFQSTNELNQSEICDYLGRAIYAKEGFTTSRAKKSNDPEYDAKLAEEMTRLKEMRKNGTKVVILEVKAPE